MPLDKAIFYVYLGTNSESVFRFLEKSVPWHIPLKKCKSSGFSFLPADLTYMKLIKGIGSRGWWSMYYFTEILREPAVGNILHNMYILFSIPEGPRFVNWEGIKS